MKDKLSTKIKILSVAGEIYKMVNNHVLSDVANRNISDKLYSYIGGQLTFNLRRKLHSYHHLSS